MEGSWDCPVRGCLRGFPSAATLEDHFEQAHRRGELIGCPACEVWVNQRTFLRLHRVASRRCSQSHREGMGKALGQPASPREAADVAGPEGAHHMDDAPHPPAVGDLQAAPLEGPAAVDDLPGFPSEYYRHYHNSAYSNRGPGEHNPFYAQMASDIKTVYGCVSPSPNCLASSFYAGRGMGRCSWRARSLSTVITDHTPTPQLQ
jgi:hypothetical protein